MLMASAAYPAQQRPAAVEARLASMAVQAVDGVYSIPEEHLDFRDAIRAIVQDKITPRAAEIDETGEYPWDVRRLLGEQDILGLPFEEEHGGTGTGTLMLQMAVEEIAKGSAAIQFRFADMATRTAAARELLYKACAMADRSAPQLGTYTSMAKLFASDTAMDVTVDAVQILGGYGYVSDYPVERMVRDAKITQIYEGTNEIQRVVIARAMSG
jgi:alkylation response protein AidB-like acyl-CoA dehydrogenase